MGFEVYRVRKEQIKSAPFAVAADIIQKYYEVVDAEDRTAKITKSKATAHYGFIPIFLLILSRYIILDILSLAKPYYSYTVA